MANLTKTEKYVALTYAKYFGKTATKGIIDDYVSIGKTSKILDQIIKDADIEQYKVHGDDLQAEVHNTFQNLFSRNADNKELQKYVKVLQKSKNLPINSIVKKATKFDKDVYNNKQEIAEYVYKNGGEVFDLSKVTKANLIDVGSLTSLTDLQAKIDALPENDFVPTVFDGQSINLTDGQDNFTGTNKNDIFTGSSSTAGSKLDTANGVDILDGKAGIDTLKISTDGATIGIPNITNIEIIEVTSTKNVKVDTTPTTGVTDLKVVKASNAAGSDAVDAIAGSETNITVSGVTSGDIKTTGGKDVTVTDTASTNANVSTITVGAGTTTPTGNVKITTNLNSDGTAALAGKAIGVTGGKTVDVTVNANSTAKAFDSNSGITTGAITVTADNKTKDVTVTQNDVVTTVTKPAVDFIGGKTTVTFNSMKDGETLIFNGLTFTAAKDLTAAEVAKAFANLTATDTQSEGGITTNGIYTGSFAAGLTSAAASGSTVVFTSTTITANSGVFTGTATTGDAGVRKPTVTTEAGTASAAEVTSSNTVTLGNVVIDDNATKSIENITVKGATTVTLGGTAATSDLDKIKTISLENVTGAVTLDTAATALNLTLNKVVNTVNLDAAAANITDLTIKTTGEKSTIGTLIADAVKNATIDAGAELVINAIGTTYVLETVTVKGTAAVTLGTVAASTNLKSFDASANKGGVTATINAATAGSHADLKTFVFSAGKDAVTIATKDINKAINLGAGDDTINFAATTVALAEITGTIDGGAGTDTIHMTAALAVAATASGSTFDTQISNIEKLSLGTLGANSTVDLAKMDNISYVISANNAAFLLTLNNMANNGTLELAGGAAATNDTTVVMKDASGTADTFNIVTNVDGSDLNMGTVTVAGVETINVTAKDISPVDAAGVATISEATLELTAAAAKTINVKGDSDIDLTLTLSTKVTMIDGSTMTGALTATTGVSTSAATIKGGSGDDELTATHDNDVLIGGKGADTLIVASGNLVQLHGGEGKDIYEIGATGNQNAYATINGTKAELSGDVIKFTGLTGFNDAKIVLGDTAVFQDYVNEAAKGNATSKASYFVWAGNTYLVQDNGGALTFTNGTDSIVKIAGVVDFTFNATTNVLEIA